MKKVLADRLAAKIKVDVSTGCWVWTGGVSRSAVGRDSSTGYPYVSFEGSMKQAYKIVWLVIRGNRPWTKGFHGHHLCLNKVCVRPDHIAWLTQAEHANEHMLLRREARAVLAAVHQRLQEASSALTEAA